MTTIKEHIHKKPLLSNTKIKIIKGNKDYIGKTAKIIRLIGDIFPYSYLVKLPKKELVYLGDEIEIN